MQKICQSSKFVQIQSGPQVFCDLASVPSIEQGPDVPEISALILKSVALNIFMHSPQKQVNGPHLAVKLCVMITLLLKSV